jgi:hypothetical protein
MPMRCEDQLILLEIYKVEVTAYSLAVKALDEGKALSVNEFLRRCDVANAARESCLAVLRSLKAHIHTHGCCLEPDDAASLLSDI